MRAIHSQRESNPDISKHRQGAEVELNSAQTGNKVAGGERVKWKLAGVEVREVGRGHIMFQLVDCG